MARIEDIERRLLNWARWKLGGTSSGLGYATARCWAVVVTPGYREAVIPTVACEAEETDRAVQSLASELRATLEVVYLMNEPMKRKIAYLCCCEATIKARIWRAHRMLVNFFSDRGGMKNGHHENSLVGRPSS